MDDEEFYKWLKTADETEGYDCPEELVRMATSPFEKAVCVEFFKLYKEFTELKQDVKSNFKWMRWLVGSIFGTVILVLIVSVIKLFLGLPFP